MPGSVVAHGPHQFLGLRCEDLGEVLGDGIFQGIDVDLGAPGGKRTSNFAIRSSASAISSRPATMMRAFYADRRSRGTPSRVPLPLRSRDAGSCHAPCGSRAAQAPLPRSRRVGFHGRRHLRGEINR